MKLWLQNPLVRDRVWWAVKSSRCAICGSHLTDNERLGSGQIMLGCEHCDWLFLLDASEVLEIMNDIAVGASDET